MVYNCLNLLLLLLFDAAGTPQRQLLRKYQLGTSWILAKPRYIEMSIYVLNHACMYADEGYLERAQQTCFLLPVFLLLHCCSL